MLLTTYIEGFYKMVTCAFNGTPVEEIRHGSSLHILKQCITKLDVTLAELEMVRTQLERTLRCNNGEIVTWIKGSEFRFYGGRELIITTRRDMNLKAGQQYVSAQMCYNIYFENQFRLLSKTSSSKTVTAHVAEAIEFSEAMESVRIAFKYDDRKITRQLLREVAKDHKINMGNHQTQILKTLKEEAAE